MNIDDMIGNDKMHSFCLPVESCVVCGDRASGVLSNTYTSTIVFIIGIFIFCDNKNMYLNV